MRNLAPGEDEDLAAGTLQLARGHQPGRPCADNDYVS